MNANIENFDHTQFFDFFKSYTKTNAIRRFKLVIKNWIKDDSKKQRPLADFKEWCNTDEAKKYWKEREEIGVNEETDSDTYDEQDESSTTDYMFSATTTTSNYTVASDVSGEMEKFFEKNVIEPEEFD